MNRFKSFIMYMISLGVSVLVLIGIGVSSSRLNHLIKEHHLHATGEISNAPPIVAFTTVALGSFRGLLADLLWLRATSLQDEGNYFEMVQLASWITKLQPKFTGATAYLAWNMAYNISVTCSLPEDRWRWIQRGIELIRDEALQYNPEDPLLYKELGWIFQHKIGNIMDDANLYYKNQIAIELSKVFGGKSPDWNEWANTPQSLAEFRRGMTADERQDFSRALDESGYAPFSRLEDYFREHEKLPESFIAKYGNAELQRRLINFLRVNWLVSVYKLDPRLILRINEKYGVLDWRLPESQAIYWATKGLEMTPSGKDINCERMITQSLKDAFMGGRLLMVDTDGFASIITVPNLNVADSVLESYRAAYEEHKSSSFRSAMLNFMKDAIVIFYNFGNYTKAQEYLDTLRKEEPGKPELSVSLDLFVLREWAEDVRDATPKQANDIISGLLYRSCNFLVYGDIDAALAHERLARFVYNRYRREHEDTWERTGLADYARIKETVTQACLRNFPPPLARILQAHLDQERARAQAEENREAAPGN